MILGIYGAGGLGREILETARLRNNETNRYNQIVFIDDYITIDTIQGQMVYSPFEVIEKFGDKIELVLAVGEPDSRAKIIKRVKVMGLDFTTLLHPNVTVPETTKVGKGCYIGPYSFISCNVEIGDYVLVQPHSVIGHDCKIGNNVVISSFNCLCGTVMVGENTYIGVSSSIIQNCNIGKDSIIGMGSVVVRDIPDSVIAIGNPARVMKNNDEKKVFK